jgi:serine phosphatase RsbU (regulator of sigma subunit)
VETATSADRCPEQLILTMKNAVGQFVGEADQSDDMTLFAIQYKNTLTSN